MLEVVFMTRYDVLQRLLSMSSLLLFVSVIRLLIQFSAGVCNRSLRVKNNPSSVNTPPPLPFMQRDFFRLRGVQNKTEMTRETLLSPPLRWHSLFLLQWCFLYHVFLAWPLWGEKKGYGAPLLLGFLQKAFLLLTAMHARDRFSVRNAAADDV